MPPATPRLLAYLLAAVALAAGLYLLAELAYLGFPDGHLTAVDQATAPLLPWGAAGSLLACGAFVYLGAARGGRGVGWAAVGYLLLVGAAVGVWVACTAGLDGGGGG